MAKCFCWVWGRGKVRMGVGKVLIFLLLRNCDRLCVLKGLCAEGGQGAQVLMVFLLARGPGDGDTKARRLQGTKTGGRTGTTGREDDGWIFHK